SLAVTHNSILQLFPYTTLFRSALYRHVANKGELLEMMFDAGIGPPDASILKEKGWRARMHAYARHFSGAFRARPWLMDIPVTRPDRKSTRLNFSHVKISYAVFC